MLSYALVVGSVIVGFSGFIIKGGATDLANNMTGLANNMTGVEYLEPLASLLPSFFKFIFAFLIVFTFFGFFHTLRWTHAHECHRQRVKKLTGWMNPEYMPTIVWKELDMEIPPMELLPNPRRMWESLKKLKKFREGFRTRYWFPALYFVMLILFAIFFPRPFKCWAIGCLGFAFWLGIGFFCSEYLELSKHSESSEHPEPSKPK
jgi:hypothetical protein